LSFIKLVPHVDYLLLNLLFHFVSLLLELLEILLQILHSKRIRVHVVISGDDTQKDSNHKAEWFTKPRQYTLRHL
jgi:hypothetical protein